MKIIILLFLFLTFSCQVSKKNDNTVFDNKISISDSCSDKIEFLIKLPDSVKTKRFYHPIDSTVFIEVRNAVDFYFINKFYDTLFVIYSDAYNVNHVSYLSISNSNIIHDKYEGREIHYVNPWKTNLIQLPPKDTVYVTTEYVETLFDVARIPKNKELYFQTSCNKRYFRIVKNDYIIDCNEVIYSNKLKCFFK